jgi:hypothetical protein
MPERTPQERETLVFDTPEAAQEFSERVAERVEQERQPGTQKKKEILAEEVAEEFAKQSEPVDLIHHPWDHTRAEHAEAQALVNLAFEKNLHSALRRAKASSYYPRNLDLFHDVLTTEMYRLLQEQRVNKQPLAVWTLTAVAVLLATALLINLLFIF